MKVASELWDFSIPVDGEYISTLIIESPDLFRKFIEDIHWQLQGHEGSLVLSHDGAEIPFHKQATLFIDPFSLTLNSKPIINGLYKKLGKILHEDDGCREVMQLQFSYEKIMQQLDFSLETNLVWNSAIDVIKLFKFLEVQVEDTEADIRERVISYVKLYQEYVNRDACFLFVNFKAWFGLNDFQEIVKMLQYNEVKCLFIEGRDSYRVENEKVWIIDEDNCFIY